MRKHIIHKCIHIS